MSLAQIKKKYKQILEDSDESQQTSPEKPERLPSALKQMRAQVLSAKQNSYPKAIPPYAGSANKNQSPFKPQMMHKNYDEELLGMRQRLAQAIGDLESKNKELEKQMQQSKNYFQDKVLLERQLSEIRSQMTEKDQELVTKEAKIMHLQKQLSQLKTKVLERDINNQMLEKQIEFYKLEQTKFKELIRQHEAKISSATKTKVKTNRIVSENERLKDDIQRLVTILNQEKRYRNIFKEVAHFDSSFLGKPLNEPENWYPRDLIRDTESFLKHQMPGNNNKEFLALLVKFVNAQNKKSAAEARQLTRKKCESKVKEAERRLNHSLNFRQVHAMNTMTTACGLLNSRISKGKRNTEAHILDRSLLKQSKMSVRDRHNASVQSSDHWVSVKELVEEFKQGVRELMGQKEPPQKKIVKLADWLGNSVCEVMRTRKDTMKISILEV